MSRPATPSTRPGANAGSGLAGNAGSGLSGVGTRPSVQPGNRPSTLPATRPGGGLNINSNKGININNNNVAISQRPAQLPGLGAGTAIANRPSGVQDRMANRPQTLEARRSDLSNRLTTGREDWQSHRGDMQDDRQDWRNNNREDWQDFAHDYHGGWYNGCWDPGDGWNYMWDNYPAAAAIGVTRWGVNRIAYGFGYWGYQNPYYVAGSTSSYTYNYSEPLVIYNESPSTETPSDPAAQTAAVAGPPEPTEPGMSAFDQSREAFYAGDYEAALTHLDVTLQTMPRDPVVHEFRGLVLFALKKYPESSAAVYAVLSASPGWDWTTMSGLYPNVDVYTKQLRELEEFAKENPKSADGAFLLGYHYLTMGHKEAASKFFAIALQLLPGDKLLTQLVDMTTPPDQKTRKTPPAPPAPADLPAEKMLTIEKLTGTWKASAQDAQFELQLKADGTFVWSFTRGESTESVQGVFALDQNNLAMEPNSGGTMLAEVDLKGPSEFSFRMIGGEVSDPGLTFKKN
ncbi:MAG: hypothetical protein JNL58_19605 [Planctomyces sp.]|nr:hypothetical protein [Planctomyces sp.]